MKQKLTLRWLLLKLTGLFFAAYSVYYIFIIIRDGGTMKLKEKIICSILVVLFGLLTGFAWTSEVKNLRFLMIRKAVLILDLLALIALKLRMAGSVIKYLEYTKLHTVLYSASYCLTIAGMLFLLIFYAFILKNLPFHRKSSVIIPLVALISFVCALALEAILFFVYHIGLEQTPIRTLISRPIFYLSFIGLALYFLYPQTIPEDDEDAFYSNS